MTRPRSGSRYPSRSLIVGVVLGSCVGCDQVTKVVAQARLAGHDSVSLLGDTVRLSYVENPGAFLGLGSGLSGSVRFWIFGVLVALVLVTLGVRGVTSRAASPARLASIALLIGGGVGNLIDRASLGTVRDFLNIGVGPIRTGIFNVADVAITVGAAAIVFSSFRTRPRLVQKG